MFVTVEICVPKLKADRIMESFSILVTVNIFILVQKCPRELLDLPLTKQQGLTKSCKKAVLARSSLGLA
jgi:hypothetical protein